MRVLSKSDFMSKIKDGYGQDKMNEELPLEMIDRVTAGVETEGEKEFTDNIHTFKEAKNMSNTVVGSKCNLEELKDILNSRQMKRVKAAMGQIRLTWADIEDLKEIKGIGPKTIKRVKTRLEKSENSINDNESVESKAKKLAQEVKEEVADNKKSPNINGKEYFNVDYESKATIKGTKLKGHVGIEIADFECVISTNSNKAVYKRCEVYRGHKEDNFDVWGKYTGKMDKTFNDIEEARFEFYLRGSNLTVTYWRSYQYQDKAKKMAVRAIEVLNKSIN